MEKKTTTASPMHPTYTETITNAEPQVNRGEMLGRLYAALEVACREGGNPDERMLAAHYGSQHRPNLEGVIWHARRALGEMRRRGDTARAEQIAEHLERWLAALGPMDKSISTADMASYYCSHARETRELLR